MIVFHGSTQIVNRPLTYVGRNDLDFGPGFYVTRLQDQAEEWAKRMSILKSTQQGYINKYEFDTETANRKYKVLTFDSYDKAWLDFVSESRRGERPWQNYDMVEGGVADDRVFAAVEAYVNGFADEKTTLEKLSFQKPSNQICIRTQDLVDECITFIAANATTQN